MIRQISLLDCKVFSDILKHPGCLLRPSPVMGPDFLCSTGDVLIYGNCHFESGKYIKTLISDNEKYEDTAKWFPKSKEAQSELKSMSLPQHRLFISCILAAQGNFSPERETVVISEDKNHIKIRITPMNMKVFYRVLPLCVLDYIGERLQAESKWFTEQ